MLCTRPFVGDREASPHLDSTQSPSPKIWERGGKANARSVSTFSLALCLSVRFPSLRISLCSLFVPRQVGGKLEFLA